MKAYLRPLLLLAGLPVLSLAACGSEPTATEGGGGTTSTTTQGGGGTTTTGGTSTGGTTGGTSTGGTTGGTSTGGTTGGTGTGGTTGGTAGTGGSVTANYDCSPPDGAVPPLKLTEIASGLDRPMIVRQAPGDNDRLFILEQPGTIRIIKGGVVLPEPFLDLTDRVHQPAGGDERGLLGLAFHPDYANNGRFFVFYTEEAGAPGDQVIAEFARSADPDLAVAQADGFGQETQNLITVADNEGNHNGGMLDFSPIDGFLYIALGDGGGAGDNHGTFGNGQNLSTMWGKILRIDVDNKAGGKNYAIPAGNMTAIPPNNPSMGMVVPEIWDFGLRNPWRFSFDPCDGSLYIADVGQGSWEEVDVELAGQGNKNYGWRGYEGNHVYDNTLSALAQTYLPPVAEYSHNGGNCSVSGGFVHRSSAIPGLRGTYFYGDYCTGRIWTFAWDGTQNMQTVTEKTAELSGAGNVSSFGYDNSGNVYVCDLGGVVYRIDAQ